MSKTDREEERRNILVRLWVWFWRPSGRFSLGALVIAGGVLGILSWGGFHWTLAMTNTETFCVSCHEMRNTVFEELKETVHYSNRSGVRATCPDCHVPKEWIYKLARKIQATNELYHTIAGSVNTPEKFEAKRIELARHVWASMKSTGSRECRNCHLIGSMSAEDQSRLARRKHKLGQENGQTCIDCHQGIAHKLPEDWQEEYDALMASEFGETSDEVEF